jgi:hypothetical protein
MRAVHRQNPDSRRQVFGDREGKQGRSRFGMISA